MTTTTWTFDYTGSLDTFVAPFHTPGTLTIAVYGAQGGSIPGQNALLDAEATTDAEVAAVVDLFDGFDAEKRVYKVGEVVAFGGVLFRCVQAHTTQADWTPAKTPALWTPVRETYCRDTCAIARTSLVRLAHKLVISERLE